MKNKKTTKKQTNTSSGDKLLLVCDELYEIIRNDFTQRCVEKGMNEFEVTNILDLSVSYGKLTRLPSKL